MEPLLVHPDPPPPVLTQALDLAGYPWVAVDTESGIERLEPPIIEDQQIDTAEAAQ